MENRIGEILLEKYFSGEANDRERLVVEQWYAQQLLANPLQQGEEFDRIKAEMWAKVDPSKKVKSRQLHLWPRFAAAMIACAIISSLLYFSNKGAFRTEKDVIYANDVAPGKSGATLTLANGKKVLLDTTSTGEIAEDSGVIIMKADDGSLTYQFNGKTGVANTTNTISTARGQIHVVKLPDQSKVWLNAESSISFNPSLLTEGIRKVELKGEAYFEIAKDKLHPFVVKSGTQEVAVLGTHFNLNAYQNNKFIKTTLLEGSVKVSTPNEIQYLKPGQQSINAGDKLQIKSEELDAVVAWKNGYFQFDESLEEIMKELARWYDVEIEFAPNAPKKESLWGYISKSNNLSAVLRQLERTEKVRFELEGRKIKILKP